MSIILDLVRELMAFRRVRIGGADVAPRAALEFDAPVNYTDDPEQDRVILSMPFAMSPLVSGPRDGHRQIISASAIEFVDGPSNAIVQLPPAQIHNGQTITIVDLGDAPRTICIRAADGEIDYIDGQGPELIVSGIGAAVTLVGFSGSQDRRSGWYVTSSRHRVS